MSFKSLVSAVSEQCHEIKQALKLFPYFETWNENVVAECCRLSSVLEFPPDNIILDSKTGNSHVVYFVLSGVCKMIHHLRARVKTDSYDRTKYKLYSSTGCNSSKTEFNTVGFTSLLLTENYDLVKKIPTEEVEKGETVEENVQSPVASSSVNDEVVGESENEKKYEEAEEGEEVDKENELAPDTGIVADYSDNDVSLLKESETRNIESPENVSDGEESKRNVEDEKEVEEKVEETPMEPSQDEPSNEPEEVEEDKVVEEDKGVETKKEIIYEPDHHIKVLEECRNKSRQTIRLVEDGQGSDIPEDVKSFFVQVCLFYKGACFGLETNVKDRIIISATKVKCLRIPRQFLLQHNPSNIWNRIRLFLDLYLPKEDKILKYFIQDREWAENKRKEAETIVFSNRIFNYTLSAQVPYSIRLLEDIPTTTRCSNNNNNNNNRRRVKKEARNSEVK